MATRGRGANDSSGDSGSQIYTYASVNVVHRERDRQLSVQFSVFVILISVTFRLFVLFWYHLAVGWDLCVCQGVI